MAVILTATLEGEPLRPANIRALFDHRELEHTYQGSYKSVFSGVPWLDRLMELPVCAPES